MREEVRWLHEKFLKKPELAPEPRPEQVQEQQRKPISKYVPKKLALIAVRAFGKPAERIVEKARKARERLARPLFKKVAFFPHSGDEGIGDVPPAKAKEIIERFGGPEKFNARRISEKHLVVRADAGVDFDKLVEMAGPKASYWKTNVWRGKPKWWRLP